MGAADREQVWFDGDGRTSPQLNQANKNGLAQKQAVLQQGLGLLVY